MKTLPIQVLICAALASFAAGTSFAGGHGNHSSSSQGFAARPAARSFAGTRFASAGGGHWNTSAGNFRAVNHFNRNGVRWNSGAYRSGNLVRNGNARWNGNRNGQWASNRNGNWNRNHHHRGNQIVFIGDYGYWPWYFPYSYSYYDPYYPYGYDSGYGYGQQPVYDGNNVDENYAPTDDKGSYPNSSNNVPVAEVQRLLARAGFYKGAIDGAMGSRTYYAIRAYQRSHNLQVDGQIGPELLNSLGRS
jgi:hypothetical protein